MAKGGFRKKFYEDIAPVVTGLGASVVILGALFKIQHYPGAGPMLIVGLVTEAILFAMFAFAPKETHYHWERVYPQLVDDEYAYDDDEAASNEGVVTKLGDMLSNAGVNESVVQKLGAGLSNLSDSVAKMSDLSNAAVATEQYAINATHAANELKAVGKAYSDTANAMKGMANAAGDASEYHSQVQAITKNLGALNSVYELELQDADKHLKAMNKFYANLSSAMENMADASKDTDKFKKELAGLTNNLTNLNGVYGAMLTAMKG
jgi:gliding motility-associated protein GldL